MGNKLNCASDRPGDQTDKKNCIIVTGEIKDRKDLEKRLFGCDDNSNKLKNVVYPYEENSALIIFEKKVDVKTLQRWIKPFEVKRLKAKEVDFRVPYDLVKRAHESGQMKTLQTNLKEVYGVEVSRQDDKVYLHGVSAHQIDIATDYLDQFLKKSSSMKQNSTIMYSRMPDEKSYSQFDKLNSVSEVEFMALEILEHGFERIKNTQLSWNGDAILIDGPASFTPSVKAELNSKLRTLRNKQSEEISLDKEEKKVVEDVMGEVHSEDMICIYDKRKSQVVVYSDKQENIMKFKHKLRLKSGKLKESVRSRKRFAENRSMSEASPGKFSSSVSSTEIGQEFSWSKDASDVAVFYTKENIKVYVYIADILNLSVDCIVNAGNYNLQHGGGIAKVIADAAGPELVQEGNAIIRKKGKITVGCQVTTTAGRLPYTCVIHTVGPCWSDYEPHNLQKVQECEEDLYTAIYGCFSEAEKIGLSTIALPAVSSGIYAVPREMCAVQYAKAVLDYSRNSRQGRALKEIHFIDKVPNLVKLMQDTFRTTFENGKVPDYNIQNYAACSSSYQRHQLKETGRKGREKHDVAVNNSHYETTEPNKLSPVYYEPTVNGKVPNCNIQNCVAFSSSYQRQQSNETGRKGHGKHDVAVNNSQYETSKPNKSSCVHYDPGVNGKVPNYSIQNYVASSSSYQKQLPKETGRKGRGKQVHSQYETTNPKKMSPVYFEPIENHKRHFVFHVSEKPVVYIYEGDILKLKHINAVVCPVDSEGSGMGRIATELMDKTKYKQNKDKCFKSWKPDLGHVVITDGEENPFNVIVHVVIENNSPQGQEFKSTIQKSIDNILRKTNECINVKTIALPLFGVKQELLTDKSWAELFLERFINFCCEVENPNLEEVHIITDVSSSSVYSTVKNVFVDYTDERNNARSQLKIAPPRPPLPEDYMTCDLTQDPMSGQGHVSKNDKGDTDDNCTVCLCPKTDPKSLPCGHSFCSECYNQMLKHKPVCAVCGKIVGTITGNQPIEGRMYVRTSSMNLAGYKEHGCIEITYDFPAGRQGPDHPSPGKWYSQMTRTAYLPNTLEGKKVCRMLQLAFDRRLMFTISTSRTTGKEGLTWNDIHHKTNPNPGAQFGYPDPEYLIRVKDELAAKGITEEDLPKEQTDV